MKKKYAFIATLSAVLLLAGCNGGENTSSSQKETSSSQVITSENNSDSKGSSSSSSSSSSTSFDITTADKVPFDRIDEVINGAFRAEVYNTSSVEIKESEKINDRVYESSETFKMLKDYTSYSEGKVTLLEKGVKKDEDNFKRRTQVLKERIEVNNVTNDYRMFSQVTDYENDKFTSYCDTASKVYILKNEEEATNSNLGKDNYILESQILELSSSYQLPKLYEFIGTQLISNVYVSQTGIQSFKRSKDSTGVTYSCLVEYSLDGDLNNVSTTTISVNFKLNTEEDQLLEAAYFINVEDASKDDPTDKYISETKVEVKMNYGTRESKAESLLNCEDYFIQTISEIEVLKIDGYGDRIPCDPNNFPLTSTYLFARAKTYTPSKALELSILHPVSSSNVEVISLDSNGYLKVLKEGITTLTFSYFGLDKDGIYREKELTQEINVTNSVVEHVSILPSNNGIEEDTIEIGKSYVLSVYVSPDKVDQSVTVSVDNPDVIKAEVDSNNNVVITGLKGGEATVTVTSKKDPTKSVSHKYFVASDMNYVEVITQNTYFHDSLYGYTFTMNFASDGTGSRVQVNKETGNSVTDTFTYHVTGIKIIFDSWSVPNDAVEAMWNFTEATIAQNGNIVSCYVESTYSTYRFIVKGA